MAKKLKIGLFMFLFTSIYSVCFLLAEAQTQAEMDNQAYVMYKKADTELNKTYNIILIKYKDDKVFLKKLRLAELAWIKYRDAELEAIYPENDKGLVYGSSYPVCYYIEIIELTQKRINELELWLKNSCEGDVCAGSRR